jgi:hypothetical protein
MICPGRHQALRRLDTADHVGAMPFITAAPVGSLAGDVGGLVGFVLMFADHDYHIPNP